jgi:hypothetical protein
MNEHDGGTNAGSNRRQFLHMGAGLAGALSVGSILAACGTSASQNAAQAPATPQKQTNTVMSLSNSYLIVAKYNYGKWKALVQRQNGDVENAESAAEMLFLRRKPPCSARIARQFRFVPVWSLWARSNRISLLD